MPSFSITTTTSTTPIHQAKRPYAGSHSHAQTHHQATITSYFPASSYSSLSLSHLSSPAAHDTTTLSPPPLPPLVQSNLLSVGMRVRKSVPEGYKTGPAPRKHGSWYAGGGGTTPAPALAQSGSRDGGAAAAAAAGGRRELAPFCGIMKVGGMGVQGWDYLRGREDERDAGMGAGVGGEEEVPGLSSQGSTVSAGSVESRAGSKRRFEEGEDEGNEEGVGGIWRDVDDDLQLSPKTRPEDLMTSFGLGRRAMAVPKSRLRGSGGYGGVKIAVMEGQENNRALEVDFGEAEFMDWSSCLG